MKPGVNITCPRCNEVMVRCIKAPETGRNNWSDCFENVKFQGVEGDQAVCPDCCIPFYIAGAGVHVPGIGFTWHADPESKDEEK